MSDSELLDLYFRYMAAPVDSEEDEKALKLLGCLLVQRNSKSELVAKLKMVENQTQRLRLFHFLIVQY